MNKKLSGIRVLIGFALTGIFTFILWNIYDITDGSLVGVLFGAVNFSIWEQVKPLLFCYIFYGLIEVTASRKYFKQFVVAKFVGLYTILLIYISLRGLLSSHFDNKMNYIVALISLLCGYLASYKLSICDYPLKNLFPTACFMILLLFILCFTFTAFPPMGELFRDPVTNLYGIVPDYIDVGAIVLDNSYF